MDEGTDAIDVLNGSVLPVKLGIVGVINRSQKDINENKTIDEQLLKENEFFNRKYPDYADRCGTSYLADTLSNLLIRHIRDHLPDLQKRVNSMILQNQDLLKLYGDGVVDKQHTLIRIITKFARGFQRQIDGTIRNAESACNTKLYRIIHEDFHNTLNQIQPIVDKNLAKDMLSENSPGPRPHLFDVPSFDVPFENLAKRHIQKLMDPSLDLIRQVHKEIKRNVQNCDTEMNIEWKRFPKFKIKIFDLMDKLVASRINIAKNMVENLIESEMAYINKNHPDFRKENAIGPLVNYKVTSQHNIFPQHHTIDVQELAGSLLSGTKGEKENCEVLQNLVKLYFEVVRKTVLDAVPKAIMFSIVNFLADNVETELFKNFYKTDGLDTLLDEANDISRKRERARSMLEVCCRFH